MWGPWGSYLTDSKEGEVGWEAVQASPEVSACSLTQLCQVSRLLNIMASAWINSLCVYLLPWHHVGVFPEKHKLQEGNVISSSQILKTTKKAPFKSSFLSNFILPWHSGAVRASRNISLEKVDRRQTKVTASFPRMKLLWNSRDF